LKGEEEHFSWKTSDWIIQEIGLAIGHGMDLILLLENGLRQPGGLQGNLEYIPFDRSMPEKSFGKLLEMIQALLPRAKPFSIPEATRPALTDELPQKPGSEALDWLEPKEDWTLKDYDFALFHAVLTGDTERERQISAAYLSSDDAQVSGNRESWQAREEHIRLLFGQGGTLTKLRDLVVKYPKNAEVQRYLALGYRHYQEHEKAGQSFIVAAEKTTDKRDRLLLHCDAFVEFFRAGRKKTLTES
jgi:hypothetical protein